MNHLLLLLNMELLLKRFIVFLVFIDAQFWTWQIIEFCRRNGLHLIIDKTRRGGFSYIMASDSSNEVNLSKHKLLFMLQPIINI